MIEKLKTLEDDEIDMSVGAVNTRFEDTELIRKINELVDAVNELQATISKMEKVETSAKNVQDKFAEQCRWIGKLCRFWNFKDGSIDIGILKAVDNLKPTIPYINDIDCSYAYCEPVKPDDDIIYKGGDN